MTSASRDVAGAPSATKLRLDKWLWHVRLQPTRTKAAQLIEDGFVRLNGARVEDAAKGVRVGDVLTLALPNRTIVARVLALPQRRGSASAIAGSYAMVENVPPSVSI